MRAGHLIVKIKSVTHQEFNPSSTPPADDNEEEEVFCAAQINDVGKLYTEIRPLKHPFSWQEEELTFNCPPADSQAPPRTLQLMLYKQRIKTSNEIMLLGMGSISLEGLEEGPNKRDIEVPIVNDIGKNCGVIKATVHFFPSRCPGKSRDDLGREVLDPILVSKGSKDGAKELNERSPKKSPRSQRAKEKECQPTEVAKGLPPEELLL